MSHGIGSGDKLARGAVRASYSTTEGGVSDSGWSKAFDDFDPERFKNAPNQSSQRIEVSSGDASLESSGDAGTDPGTTEASEQSAT